MRITYDKVNLYRTELMGIAAILVFLNHSKLFLWDDKYGFVLKLFSEGGVGVDVFILLSGIGLYYSYANNTNAKSFYRRRASRIMPTYLSVATILFGIKCIVNGSFKRFLLDLSLISYWIYGDGSYWYVAYVLVFYFLYPFIFNFMLKSRKNTVVAISLMYLVQIVVLLYANDLYCRLQFFFSRLPITIIACWLGKKSYEKETIGKKYFALCMLAFICIRIFRIIFVPEIYEGWVTFLVKTANCYCMIVFIYLYAILREKIDICLIDRHRKLGMILPWFLTFMGNMSLEVYLIHVSMISCVFLLVKHEISVHWYFLVGFPLTCLLSYIDKRLIEKIC